MRFIEREDGNSLEYGDFILFFNDIIGVVVSLYGGECGVVHLEDGYMPPGLQFSDLEELEDYIKEELPSARIIKSRNIEIKEV